MSSKASYTKNVKKTVVQETELVPVRSTVLYGLEIKKVDEKKKSSERNIAIVPNITFYDSYTKAMIDFSDYRNNPEKSNVKDFFDLITPGFNFTLTNGTWKNASVDKLTFNLNGTYKFTKIVDSIVFVEVVSVTKITEKITRYDKESFLELPVFELPTVISKGKKQIRTYVINGLGKNTKNSFSYLGAYVGDYIQIQNNKQKYKILLFEQDIEGKEVMTVEGEILPTSSVGIPILITLFQENNNKILTDSFDNQILGKISIISSDNTVVCVDSSTLLQSKLRENSVEKISTIFYPNEFCVELTQQAEIITSQNTISSLKEENVTLKNQLTSRSTIESQNSSLLSSSNLLNRLFT